MVKKVAFGATLLYRGLYSSGIDGIGHYCQELLNQYSKNPEGFEIVPYAFGINANGQNIHTLNSYPKHISSLISPKLDPEGAKFFREVDLIHATDQLIPIVRDTPLVATVMDTIPLSHPQFIKAQSRFIKPYLWSKLTQRADHLITISEFSKSEIIKFFDYPAEKITSIPLGVDNRYFQRSPNELIKATLDSLHINKPFFLFIGSIQPRKNLLNLLKAHESLPNHLAKEYPLVIAGKFGWNDGQTLKAIKKGIEDKRCIWVNYVNDNQKRHLLQSCVGMAFTSLYEGFGLPILEAFASASPVITSNCTSMPEVAADCALFVDPLSPFSIRNALLQLIQDGDQIKILTEKGLLRAKEFTWTKVAEKTQKVYQMLI